MSKKAREKERARRVRDVFRVGALVGHEVARVIEGHEDHHESAQDIDRNQARQLGGEDGNFCVDG